MESQKLSDMTRGNLRGLIMLILLVATVALGAYTYSTIKEAKYLHTGPVTISVSGTGEVLAKPDIATFTFSVRSEGADAAEAQSASAEDINSILEYLEEEGVEEKDIRTQYYSLNPRYEWTRSICDTTGYCPPGERILRGYEVNQTVSVKVRDTQKAGELISGVGAEGATDVSGLDFTIDDEEALLAEAREKAIANAKEKAQELADDLGVRVKRLAGFWEDQGYPKYYGMGGDAAEERAFSMDSAAVAPSIPTGENTITSNVTLIYEVR